MCLAVSVNIGEITEDSFIKPTSVREPFVIVGLYERLSLDGYWDFWN
jgi:hypothetical protein